MVKKLFKSTSSPPFGSRSSHLARPQHSRQGVPREPRLPPEGLQGRWNLVCVALRS